MKALENISTQMLEQNFIILLLIVAVVFAINWTIKRLFKKAAPKNTKKLNVPPKLHLVLDAMNQPIRAYLWLVIFYYFIYIVCYKILKFTNNIWFGKLIFMSTFAVILWSVFRFIKGLERFYIEKHSRKAQNYSFEVSGIKALSRIAQVITLLIFTIILLGVLQIPLSGLVTVGGVGGIAIAYAGKDILSNFLGGVMIYVNRQFAIGDAISSPDRDIAGTIEKMGWRYTTVRRNDRQVMYIPNSVFSGILLVNSSRISHRLINQTFGIRYSDISKIPALFKELKSFLDQDPDVDHSQATQLYISSFAASSVNFTVSIYMSILDKHSFNQVQDTLFLKVAEIIEKNGAEFASPP